MATKPVPASFEERRLMSRLEFLARNNISKSEFDRRKKRIEAEMERTGLKQAELPPHIGNLLPNLTWTSRTRYGVSYADELAWQHAPKSEAA